MKKITFCKGMSRKSFSWIILFFCVFFLTNTNAQNQKYNIIFLGKNIGFVDVDKTVKEDSTVYYFKSETDFSFIFMSMKTKAITRLAYVNKLLETAYVLRNKNEKSQELNYIRKENNYQVVDNEKEYTINSKIYFCSANFFFDEPIHIKKVFIERFNYFVDIESLGNHQYQTKVDGGTNLYTYKNGVLQSVKSIKGFTVFMELVE